jgi:N-acetylmuramate 1-kinase
MPADTTRQVHPIGLALELAEAELLQLAKAFSSLLVRGDCVALQGDLGAGKTTFARTLVRAFLSDPAHDVPSPTFALRQDYRGARGDIAHFDLYRLSDARELDELGFDEGLEHRITLVEWPERAVSSLPPDRFELQLSAGSQPDVRHVALNGLGRAAARATGFAASWRERHR